jgi:hypothetical protein
VTEDASLDEFFGAGDDPDASPDAAATDEPNPEDEMVGDEVSDDGPGDAGVPPFLPTCQWAPAGGTCTDCGTTVERRWTDERDGATVLVCHECKRW